MTTIPKFIKVHDLADPDTVYTVNSNKIVYYCNMNTPDGMTSYTFLELMGGVTVKITETVQELNDMLEVYDEDEED